MRRAPLFPPLGGNSFVPSTVAPCQVETQLFWAQGWDSDSGWCIWMPSGQRAAWCPWLCPKLPPHPRPLLCRTPHPTPPPPPLLTASGSAPWTDMERPEPVPGQGAALSCWLHVCHGSPRVAGQQVFNPGASVSPRSSGWIELEIPATCAKLAGVPTRGSGLPADRTPALQSGQHPAGVLGRP